MDNTAQATIAPASGALTDLGSKRLQGRVAFVSGGLRGIGLATVERFLAEGAEVVLSDLDVGDKWVALDEGFRVAPRQLPDAKAQ